VVGPWGLEPQTSCVSSRRSNQLSYGPTNSDYFITHIRWTDAGPALRGRRYIFGASDFSAGTHDAARPRWASARMSAAQSTSILLMASRIVGMSR
jgi:hypothetical protein